MHLRFTLAAGALALAASCATTAGEARTAQSVGPWLAASPNLSQQIQDQITRLPWTHGLERVETIHWFASVGEPAYEELLELVADPRSDVAGAALAALGATRDSRLVEPLRRIPWPTDSEDALGLERARALLRLGDWSMIPRLIEGLGHESFMVRTLCLQALQEATHEDFDYHPGESEPVRRFGVVRWQEWWSARSADPILTGGG
ncbi:MAG: hypothetical protein QF903_03080 [Planctomycetota bacterium]|jgi:HEAT repeat protein|nr:hypothetical protein [Planctomycetota bacterium]MDP6761792.1 hypothetical protein [Planctomycetota bacterium]MDP6988441.1 hypothetical protein [Planctomycetota bacterium]